MTLRDGNRHAEAADALDRAKAERGDEPTQLEIILALAQAAETAQQKQRAFHAYLEAASTEPSHISSLLAHAHELLDVTVAIAEKDWLFGEWASRMAGSTLDTRQRIWVQIFLGRARLFIAEPDNALENFQTAEQIDPVEARRQAELFLSAGWLPPSLENSTDREASLTRARVYMAFGLFDTALQWAESAISASGTGDNYPEAEAQELKARVLESAGQEAEAATWFYEAGWRLGARGDHRKAAALLGESVRLRPSFAPAYWSLTEALRLDSYQAQRPWVNEASLRESLRIWNSRPAEPDPEFAWVYSTRALLNELLSRLPGQDRWLLAWEGIAFLESALIGDANDSFALACLGRFYRGVHAPANSLATTRKAVEVAPENALALEERIAILADVRQFPEAEAVIEKRRSVGASDWVDAVKGYILVHSGRSAEALPLLTKAVDSAGEDSGDFWYWDTRAVCHRELKQDDQAAVDLERIRSRFDPSDEANRGAYASAFYNLGDYQTAIDLSRQMTQDPLNAGSAARLLALCYARAGNLDAARDAMKEGIWQAADPWSLQDFAQMDLRPVEEASANNPDGEALRNFLAEFRSSIDRKVAEFRAEPVSQDEELRRVIDGAAENETVRVAASAGLARTYVSQERWVDASRTYAGLLAHLERFPVASAAFTKTLDQLQAAGVRVFEAQEFAGAFKEYLGPAWEVATQASAPIKAAELAGQIGYAHFVLEQWDEAGAWFFRALATGQGISHKEAGVRLGEICSALIADPPAYWKLDDFWSAIEQKEGTPAEIQEALSSARKALENYQESWYGLGASKMSAKPVPLELISLEAHPDLCPPENNAEWPVLKTYLPEMRERLRAATGIIVPGVMLRDNAVLPDDGYRILIKGVVRASGLALKGFGFCLASHSQLLGLGIPQVHFGEVSQPWSGQPGCWLTREHWETAQKNGLELYEDPWRYAIRHLESVLSWYRAAFLGREEVERLLDTWRNADGESLVKGAAANADQRQRLSRVLRALASELVPITDWHAILEGVIEAGLENNEVAPAVRAVRRRIKEGLPGNAPSIEREWIPEDLEAHLLQGISRYEYRVYFSLTWQDALEVLGQIRSFLQSGGYNVALVTRSGELRPFLQRVVKLEFPAVNVLSSEELTSDNSALFHSEHWSKQVQQVHAAG